MSVVPTLLIVAAMFALAVLVRVALSARGFAWAFGWKAWLALGAAVALLAMGRWGGAMVFAGLGLYLARSRPAAPSESAAARAARALLGVGPAASAQAIRAAYRRKMASAHPDAGGRPDQAQALTDARDLLLKKD
jgi:hypothetical protein